MTYNPLIPQPTDIISSSQADLLTNFTQLNEAYGDADPAGDPNSDHYPFDDTSGNARKHRKVRLPELTLDPGAVLNQGTVYTKDNGAGRTDLFYRYDSGALSTGGGSLVVNMLPIKAFAELAVDTTEGPQVLNNSFNVASISRDGAVYTVTLQQRLPSANYGVQIKYQNGAVFNVGYTIIDDISFSFNPSVNTNGDRVNFMVIQA